MKTRIEEVWHYKMSRQLSQFKEHENYYIMWKYMEEVFLTGTKTWKHFMVIASSRRINGWPKALFIFVYLLFHSRISYISTESIHFHIHIKYLVFRGLCFFIENENLEIYIYMLSKTARRNRCYISYKKYVNAWL